MTPPQEVWDLRGAECEILDGKERCFTVDSQGRELCPEFVTSKYLAFPERGSVPTECMPGEEREGGQHTGGCPQAGCFGGRWGWLRAPPHRALRPLYSKQPLSIAFSPRRTQSTPASSTASYSASRATIRSAGGRTRSPGATTTRTTATARRGAFTGHVDTPRTGCVDPSGGISVGSPNGSCDRPPTV
jgi:hypothetical protein